jgi:DNA-binding NtrC family response regulator
LAAAQGAIKGMGGSIEVETQRGKGTTMRLWLPLHDSHASTAHPEALAPMLEDLDSATVLLVEHDPNMLRILRHHFENAGFKVIAQRDDTGILEACQGLKPTIALLDYTFPLNQRPEVPQELRARFPDLYIALMSSYSVKHLKANLDMNQFDAFLPKPFNLHQLNQMIGEMLHQDD